MKPERWSEVERVLDAALERPPREWPALLEETCATDPALRREVESLLRRYPAAQDFLQMPAAALNVEAERYELEDRRIGSYRLECEIARGGMGRVFLAERADGEFQQRVALKLLRPGLEREDAERRFRVERQVLAALSHPNIARLLDGGLTAEGQPYLVMEYVEGVPIDRYCDERRLPIKARLELFCTVCEVVQYAHRNLIVHRDLKPSNILVEEDGRAKLLDFGIAKLLAVEGAPLTLPVTQAGQQWLTPEYAAPEQIRCEAATTATDVYQLGVVLYELLTGRRLFERHGKSPDEVAQAVLEREPARPSAAVTHAADRTTGEEAPERLSRMLRGDLDAIVLRALRKEPELRYASAEALVEDIRRYLAGLPVEARHGTHGYRARKFVRRHRWGVSVTAGFVLLLGGYATTLTLKEGEVRAALEHASLEAERAEQVTGFLMRLFEATDPHEVESDAITARELLERGTARAEQFAHQPAKQAQMLDVIGRTYQHLGQYERAQPLLERALDLRRGLFGDMHSKVGESLHHLARLHHARGQLDSAEVLLRRGLHIQRQLLGAEHAQVARTLSRLSLVLQDRGDYAQAALLAREVLDLRRRVLGAEHPEVAESLHDLAEILRRQGEYAAAEPLYREALALRQRLFGDEHAAVAETLHNLAHLLQLQGDLAEVEPLYRQALGIYRRLFGETHPAVARTTSNLGLLMFRVGNLDAADSLYREALAIRRQVLRPEHPDVALSLGLLAAVQRRKGELESAEALYRESLAMQRRVLGSEHPDMAHKMSGLALVLRDRGQYEAADSLYEQVLAMRQRLLGEAHPAVAMALNDRGLLMQDRGDYSLAESLLLQALEMRRQLLGDGHPHVEQSFRNLAVLYERWNRPEQAQAFRELLGER